MSDQNARMVGPGLVARVPTLEDEALAGAVEASAESTAKLLEEVDDELARVQRDGNLTDEGKAARRVEVVREAAKRFTATAGDETAAGLRERAETEAAELTNDATLFPLPEDADPHQAREIRDLARQMEPEDRGTWARERLEAGDTAALRAVLDAPAAFPILDEETAAEIRRRRAEEVAPERAQRLRATRSALDLMDTNRRKAVEALQARAGRERLELEDGPGTPSIVPEASTVGGDG